MLMYRLDFEVQNEEDSSPLHVCEVVIGLAKAAQVMAWNHHVYRRTTCIQYWEVDGQGEVTPTLFGLPLCCIGLWGPLPRPAGPGCPVTTVSAPPRSHVPGPPVPADPQLMPRSCSSSAVAWLSRQQNGDVVSRPWNCYTVTPRLSENIFMRKHLPRDQILFSVHNLIR